MDFSLCLSLTGILEGHLKKVGTFHSAVFCICMLLNKNVEMEKKNTLALTCNEFDFSASNSSFFVQLSFSFPDPYFHCSRYLVLLVFWY